ncbi:hypothetical protein O0L34_g18692 [Tuta absoluta]|nr:hypothetical protein O0L34_g18692 [Tuta absoluta]
MVEEQHRGEAPAYLAVAAHSLLPPDKPSNLISFCSFIFNLFLFVGLFIIICAVLEYHCTSCEAMCNMNSLSKNIEDIARNLASIERNYHELETQISQFSRDLPKIEGQLELLGALATMEQNRCRFKAWEPRSLCYLPNVDVNLAQGDVDSTMDVATSVKNPAPKNYTKSMIITDTNSAIVV